MESTHDDTVALFRPVGQAEYELICQGGFRSFPPRLPGQPIFYPVLSRQYAEQIARDWNTKDGASGFRGYVLKFKIRKEFLRHYEPKQVGSAEHMEYWIPSGVLDEFNRNIVGLIEVIAKFGGLNFA
jgi:hypothetical protein